LIGLGKNCSKNKLYKILFIGQSSYKPSPQNMSTIVLFDNEYCHITNNEDGTQYLVEGPKRLTLSSSESCPKGKQNKVTLKQTQYCIVENPFDKNSNKYEIGGFKLFFNTFFKKYK
jgi:hypothetical protein